LGRLVEERGTPTNCRKDIVHHVDQTNCHPKTIDTWKGFLNWNVKCELSFNLHLKHLMNRNVKCELSFKYDWHLSTFYELKCQMWTVICKDGYYLKCHMWTLILRHCPVCGPDELSFEDDSQLETFWIEMSNVSYHSIYELKCHIWT
jgi:hypothetical protein